MKKLGRPPVPESARRAWAKHRPRSGSGKLAQLAKVLGIKQANFNSSWEFVPERHLIATAEFLQLDLKHLRPDLYPPDDPWAELEKENT